jgi:cell division protein FtsN
MKLRAVTVTVLLGVMSVTLISGCSRERIDWKSAEAADTQEAYDHFLERHPDSELATQARARIAQLTEDKDWQRAIAADNADAYRSFLAQHATGKWAEEARIRLENFTLDANVAPGTPPAAANAASPGEAAAAPGESAAPAARATTSGSSSAAPAAHAATSTDSRPARAPTANNTAGPSSAHSPAPNNSAAPPHGPPSKPAPVATAIPATSDTPADTSSGYGIQLGAFTTQERALAEWKRLQLKFDPQLHGLFARAVPVTVTSGTLFRLQSPVTDEARARSICSELTERAQPCVVVLPESR